MEKHFNALNKKQASLDHQDWKQVTIRSTQSISQEKKQCNKKISQAQQKDIKLHKQVEEDNLKHTKITQELRTKIIQGRASHKWKQKDLAQKCNLPVSVINEIESGKAIYNPQHINKIKRILKI
jgi:ribosome-binding protein aMBF1 (putative translation factor)